MSRADIRVAAEREVDASAERMYGYIADYREHHRFLPSALSDYRVKQGGVGGGTVVRFRLTVGGLGRAYRGRIAEPNPGRVLTGSDPDAGTVTTFTVTPDSRQSLVRIETVWSGAGGLAGVVERLIAPRLLRQLYLDELACLDQYAREYAAN